MAIRHPQGEGISFAVPVFLDGSFKRGDFVSSQKIVVAFWRLFRKHWLAALRSPCLRRCYHWDQCRELFNYCLLVEQLQGGVLVALGSGGEILNMFEVGIGDLLEVVE